MLTAHPDTTKFPQSTNPDGNPRDMPSDWWCSGFFGGSLWYLYEQTGDLKWKQAAHRWTMAVAKEKTNITTHDLGFMLYCVGENSHFLLKHSVGAKPMKSEVDVPLVYADYHHLEALLRYDALRKKQPLRF